MLLVLARLAAAVLVLYSGARFFSGQARDVKGKVKRATVDGREYEIFRRGGGTFEIVSQDNPENFIVFGQTGELTTNGEAGALAVIRSDMQRFPGDLFA